jgi:hypothetical protein
MQTMEDDLCFAIFRNKEMEMRFSREGIQYIKSCILDERATVCNDSNLSAPYFHYPRSLYCSVLLILPYKDRQD